MIKEKDNEIAILYSGGTDSTCAAYLMAERFQKINLLTIQRYGIFSVDKSCRNVSALREKFPAVIFIHNILKADSLAEYLNYSRFFRNLLKYGFFTLSNCFICCLVNHFKALIYCLENEIVNVADGVTREWPFFPSHMEPVIEQFRQMYSRFNINYLTPVYDFDIPAAFTFIDKIYSDQKLHFKEGDAQDYIAGRTTGRFLFEKGILPAPNVKGTGLDHSMQPKCLQFVLHHIFLRGYFMHRYDYRRFEEVTAEFLKEKISDFIMLIEHHPRKLKQIIDK